MPTHEHERGRVHKRTLTVVIASQILAGTDLAPAHRRGFGTSMAMVATTVGAVAGPNLITPMGLFAESIGVPTLAGPFILGAATMVLTQVVMHNTSYQTLALGGGIVALILIPVLLLAHRRTH